MNKTLTLIKRRLAIICLVFTTLLGSCKKDVKNQNLVYSNDFETSDLKNISGGSIERFNNTNVLGRYNAGGFNINLTGLAKHDLVQISFDLYIHDSWDGNELGLGGVDGPDIWKMIVDKQEYINTTFSNADCNGNLFCLMQAYPNDYPNNDHNPKTGAFSTNLPGACSRLTSPNGTTLYKITKTINHTSSAITFGCLDQLVQTNVADKKCDESWSVDNIKITTITL